MDNQTIKVTPNPSGKNTYQVDISVTIPPQVQTQSYTLGQLNAQVDDFNRQSKHVQDILDSATSQLQDLGNKKSQVQAIIDQITPLVETEEQKFKADNPDTGATIITAVP